MNDSGVQYTNLTNIGNMETVQMWNVIRLVRLQRLVLAQVVGSDVFRTFLGDAEHSPTEPASGVPRLERSEETHPSS